MHLHDPSKVKELEKLKSIDELTRYVSDTQYVANAKYKVPGPSMKAIEDAMREAIEAGHPEKIARFIDEYEAAFIRFRPDSARTASSFLALQDIATMAWFADQQNLLLSIVSTGGSGPRNAYHDQDYGVVMTAVSKILHDRGVDVRSLYVPKPNN